MALLQLIGLEKTYDRPAVRQATLQLEQGQILGLLGPSGCGKTTLLRMVAGLEPPDRGRVVYDGRDLTAQPPHLRRFGLMFQDFALFPHKNVFENVAYGLQTQKLSRRKIQTRTLDMLDLVGLTEMAQRSVADLSGGERQRVALARSLAPKPRLLMLDEPLGALDRSLRERLMLEIRHILKTLDMTAIFVTHDQTEALMISDRVAVMNAGRIEQIDPPEQLYLRPKSLFVARFLGFKNLIPGAVAAPGIVSTELGRLYPADLVAEPGESVTIVLRPEGAQLATDGTAPKGDLSLAGRVKGRLFTGQNYRTTIAIDRNSELVFNLPIENPPPPIGAPIFLVVQAAKMVVIPA